MVKVLFGQDSEKIVKVIFKGWREQSEQVISYE